MLSGAGVGVRRRGWSVLGGQVCIAASPGTRSSPRCRLRRGRDPRPHPGLPHPGDPAQVRLFAQSFTSAPPGPEASLPCLAAILSSDAWLVGRVTPRFRGEGLGGALNGHLFQLLC